MSLLSILKKRNDSDPIPVYSLVDTFGCSECPPQNCPTFLERDVHRKFQNALQCYNIIVVYGESRQGKTWTIERYCPRQLRIGCTSAMTFDQMKSEMLHIVGLNVLEIEHSITDETEDGNQVLSQIGFDMIGKAGLEATTSAAHKETMKTTYPTVDMNKSSDFLHALKNRSDNQYFVFDNFHYLAPTVQQQFCSLLKEFNYQGIKVIIVGVWKESSKITALAPDLVNRCEHIDIGSWSSEELNCILAKGEEALNIRMDHQASDLFKRCCASNIGIFKDFLLKFCQGFGIEKTQQALRVLSDPDITQKTAEMVIQEAYAPLHDRIKNLATARRDQKNSKHMRQKIVDAILQLVIENDTQYTKTGLSLSAIHGRVDKICQQNEEELIGISNITQELGVLHEREENRQTDQNFIPLFYFDKTNRKLLVIEPTIYEIKAYDCSLLQDLVNELESDLREPYEQMSLL